MSHRKYGIRKLFRFFFRGSFRINPDDRFGIEFPQMNPAIGEINFHSVYFADRIIFIFIFQGVQ